nr:hypothetical protein CFP56_58482 [Quercus suber]
MEEGVPQQPLVGPQQADANQHQAESRGSQHSNPLADYEHEGDREGSTRTTHADRSPSRGKGPVKSGGNLQPLYVPLGILSLTIGLATVFAIAHYTRPRSEEEENPERTTEPQNTNRGVSEPHELGGVTVRNVPTRLARLPDPIGSPALPLRVAV